MSVFVKLVTFSWTESAKFPTLQSQSLLSSPILDLSLVVNPTTKETKVEIKETKVVTKVETKETMVEIKETMVEIKEAIVVILAPLFVEPMLMIMVLESASATQVSSGVQTDVKLVSHAELTKSELLMEDAAVLPDSPTTTVSAQNVPVEPSGALLPTNAFMFVDKTQPMTWLVANANALMVSD